MLSVLSHGDMAADAALEEQNKINAELHSSHHFGLKR